MGKNQTLLFLLIYLLTENDNFILDNREQRRDKREKYKIKRQLFSKIAVLFWWERVDSNHRSYKQQIYSLSPLATRELSHTQKQKVGVNGNKDFRRSENQ